MHHDRTVNTAVQTIVANDPHVRVVEYESLEYALTIHRTVGRVVWVSHGSEQGILAGHHAISWDTFSDRVELTPGYDIILACNSNSIKQYISSSSKSQVFTFDGLIDATLGGFFAIILLSGSHNALTSAFQRAIDLATHSCTPDYLLWSTMEKAWFAIDAAIFIVSALSTSFAVWKATLNPAATMDVFAVALQFLSVFLQLTVFLCGALSGTFR
ncbi:MAG: hypothetical protein K9W43_03240 [Candidatus Thorarchaeota archaeon]|nr:hypothetical protein [Candidatus Thorarchaeota archaeon]